MQAFDASARGCEDQLPGVPEAGLQHWEAQDDPQEPDAHAPSYRGPAVKDFLQPGEDHQHARFVKIIVFL